jgi:hypothetical protein
MEKAQYREKLSGFTADLTALEDKLADLDVQRDETKRQIEHTKRIIANLSALCGVPHQKDLSVVGFTDACRAVLRDSFPAALTAAGLRDALAKGGYDLAGYSNALASIYTILRRLEGAGEVEKKQEGLKTAYLHKPHRFRRLRHYHRRRRPLPDGPLSPLTGGLSKRSSEDPEPGG